MLKTAIRVLLFFCALSMLCPDLAAQSRSHNPGSDRGSQNRQSSPKNQQAGPSRVSKNNSRKQPVLGSQVTSPPKKALVVEVNKTGYRYSDGIFYHPKGSVYIPAPGPAGARIEALPPGHTTVIVQGIPYFYFYGTFYARRGVSVYEVVDPPLGAVIYDLPLGFEKVIIDNVSYYVYGNTYYKAIIDSYGEVAYEVVGKVR